MSDPVPADDSPTTKTFPVPDFEPVPPVRPKPRPLKGAKLRPGKPTDPDYVNGAHDG